MAKFKEICIHAGLTKTGSTSLQLGLKAIAAELDNSGVVYPDFPGSGSNGANHGMALRHLAGFRSDAPFGHSEKYHDPEAAAKVFATFCAGESGGQNLILSSETLPAIPELQLQKLAHQIRQWGDKDCIVRMFLVVRHPLQWMNSSRNEFLRHGFSVSDLSHPQGVMAHALQKDWLKETLQKLHRVGLADDLTVWRHEDLPSAGGLLKVFGDWAGLSVPIPEVHANESLNWEVLKLMDGQRDAMPIEPHEMTALLAQCRGSRSLPSAEEARHWQGRWLEDTNRVLLSLGLPPYGEELGSFDCCGVDLWSEVFFDDLYEICRVNPAIQPFIFGRLHHLEQVMSLPARERLDKFKAKLRPMKKKWLDAALAFWSRRTHRDVVLQAAIEAAYKLKGDPKTVLVVSSGEVESGVREFLSSLSAKASVVHWALRDIESPIFESDRTAVLKGWSQEKPLARKAMKQFNKWGLDKVVALGWDAAQLLSHLPLAGVPVLGILPESEMETEPPLDVVVCWGEVVNRGVVFDMDWAQKMMDIFHDTISPSQHPHLQWLHSPSVGELLIAFNAATTEPFPPIQFREVRTYAKVEEILRRPEVVRLWPEVDADQDDKRLNVLDGPEHRALRSMVQPLFTPKALNAIEEALVGVLDTILASINGDKSVDANLEISGPLNLQSLSVFTGLSVESLAAWEIRAKNRIRRLSPDVPNVQLHEIAFFRSLEEDKSQWFNSEKPPEGSLLAHFLNLDLSVKEIYDACGNLLQSVILAGVDVTRSLINQILNHLNEHPELWDVFRQDPEVIPKAIEEFLRFYSTSEQLQWLVAKRDFQVEGEVFQAGERLRIFIKEANRDPDVFERPDEFRLDRPQRRHLAFGLGAHHCLGAWLVRTQVRIMLEKLTQRTDIIENLKTK